MIVWLIGIIDIPLSFRAIASLLTALGFSLWMGPLFIKYLHSLQIGQIIRQDSPKSHVIKRGTPTMGGIMILSTVITTVLLWADLTNLYVWVVLFVLLGYGAVGFIDDYRKVTRKSVDGLAARWKYFWQSLIASVIVLTLYVYGQDTTATQLFVPFFRGYMPQLGLSYVVFTYLVIVGSSNAVNLTDGLDGLAIVPTILVSGGLSILAWATGNANLANDLHIPYIFYSSELVAVCTAIIGAGLGFLWFNAYPAQLLMGDVGSLALGGALGTVAVLVRQELILLIMGGLFVVETLSVIFQVSSYRLRGRRIFRMAPIHHHYELKGWPEPRVVVRFWIISTTFVLVGLAALSLTAN